MDVVRGRRPPPSCSCQDSCNLDSMILAVEPGQAADSVTCMLLVNGLLRFCGPHMDCGLGRLTTVLDGGTSQPGDIILPALIIVLLAIRVQAIQGCLMQ
jgi:hypothetical protein